MMITQSENLTLFCASSGEKLYIHVTARHAVLTADPCQPHRQGGPSFQ